ncbi:MAG TPA: response regulator transcription factor [Burkholderiaceae bacterium]|nr:response regulator transcription factor [Burkholderiaceae bacterium]
MAQILVVDDHWLFAAAIEREVRRLAPESECFRAGSLADALTLVRLGKRFDLVLLDLRLPDAQGLSAVEALRREAPQMRVAVISAYGDSRVMREAYRLEAVGYLSKASAPESFERGLQLLLSGGFYYPPEALEPQRPSGPHGLTPREGDVLGQLVRGMTSKQIARKLGLAPATVDKHVEQIRVKLGARSRIQLLARLGDLDADSRR